MLCEEKGPCPWEKGDYRSPPAPVRTQSRADNGHSVWFWGEMEPGNRQACFLSAATAFAAQDSTGVPKPTQPDGQSLSKDFSTSQARALRHGGR